MTALYSKSIKRNLVKKGFRESNTDHKRYYYYSTEGKKTDIRTKLSHGDKTISKDLIAKMAKQIKLTNGEFVRFASCDISQEEYEEIVNSRRIL